MMYRFYIKLIFLLKCNLRDIAADLELKSGFIIKLKNLLRALRLLFIFGIYSIVFIVDSLFYLNIIKAVAFVVRV